MAIGAPAGWDALASSNVDLGDLLGTPGLDAGVLAEQADAAFGSSVRQLGDDDALILSARRLPDHSPPPAGLLDAALQALATAAPGVVPEVPAIRQVRTLPSLSGTHLVAQQQVRGFDVVGGTFRLHLDGRAAYSMTGRPLGDLEARDPGPPPAPVENAVVSAARDHFNLPPEQAVDIRQVLFPVKGAGVWAWRVLFTTEDPSADYRAFLNADDLSVMLAFNVSAAALVGEANVYAVNPLRTPDLIPVCLYDLGPDPADRLTGSVIDVRPRNGDPFSHQVRDCRMDPGDAGFDEASTYHHLRRAIRYFADIASPDFFAAVPFTPVHAVVRDDRSPANAFYFPNRGELSFGDFGAGDARPSARSADMIFHEFGHAVTDSICRLTETPLGQPKALSEGFSDYFACSALDDPRFGDYVMNQPEGARNCAKPGLRFPAGFAGEAHGLGEVWANVLWGIRSRLGRPITDRLVLESLYFAHAFTSFDEARHSLLEADRQLFPADDTKGRHADAINEEYEARLPAPPAS